VCVCVCVCVFVFHTHKHTHTHTHTVMMPSLEGLSSLQKIELYRNLMDVLPELKGDFSSLDEFQVANTRL
jgi:hypothetical protein